jgi:hypothetical protein
MPYNIDSNGNTDNISFGPAVVYLGPSGATPTASVGYVGEDAVTLEVMSTKRDIEQGNPKTIEFSFATQQKVKVSWQGIEWDQDLIQYAVGAGNTYVSPSVQTWTIGGDPIVETVAIKVQHYMAKAGDTLTCNVWKARADGTVSIGFSAEEHKFANAYEAMRSPTNWGGATLAVDEQLFQMVRQVS